MEYPGGCSRNQSGFAPENLTTFAHFSVSSAMSFPKSAGETTNAEQLFFQTATIGAAGERIAADLFIEPGVNYLEAAGE